MKIKHCILGLSIAAILAMTLSGCATTANKDDPLQSYNRAMFSFNNGFDDYFMRPVTKVYDFILPSFLRTGVRNFFANIGNVPDIINDVLQWNWHYAQNDAERLVLNTVLGILGTVDVASEMGIYPHTQSFGLTMAKWGYTNSDYFVLPFLGPSTIRGTIGIVPDWFFSPMTYIQPYYIGLGMRGLQLTQLASDNLPRKEMITENALDPYIAVRNAYMQNRQYLIKQVQTDGAYKIHGEGGEIREAQGATMLPPKEQLKTMPLEKPGNSTVDQVHNNQHLKEAIA